MKYILLLTSLLLVFISCQREEACKTQRLTGIATSKIVDTNPNSIYYLDTVMWVKRNVVIESYHADCLRCCPSPKCIEILGLQVNNRTSQTIHLKMELTNKGTFSFTIPKGDSISVTPLPDYCYDNTWGKVTEISYQ